ncbi:hypothetical protein LCGC14_2426390 [marine sediment metagenome]|uniref:Thioredoxin domain-containing protein n=1 Tax=marine sediment metagenome TaxID=412755 RepID=A0A0F9BNA2_9ZZZZ
MKPYLLAGLLACAPVLATAQSLTDADVKRLALEAIVENPEIVMEAISILQQREADAANQAKSSVLSSERELLEQDPNAPVMGNPDGAGVIVEFFDYNCPYCRKAAADVKALLGKDDDVRVVYREWPILGEGSVFAARAALAAREQGKYEELHWRLMELDGRAEEASVLAVAEEIGMDIDKLQADMDKPEVAEHVATSMRLAEALGFNGTPSFVIGDALVPGVVPLDQLEALVDESRKPE